MFSKILIANRGEIACRVIDTARSLGVATVAVYSEADAAARHVALADEAVAIGGPRPANSYLRGDVIIQAALQTGAQAIHPGYGFLSENPEFVEAVEAAGLTFIGPSAKAIRAMGLKDAAKALMAKAGVPVVPGYHGENQDPEHLAGAAEAVGYPVLIKAVAGGGGKGMRRVERAQDFMEALQSAQGEAQTAFGNPAVLIEKYIEMPRHIEVQVFGDGTHAVHLFERDCSLQRRHQKVIEEAPAPGMTEEMRAAMGQAAVRAAEAIGYSGAGTVEFIVDGAEGLRPDRFWFMEMNTRLQVEHPVTEAITGIDLVEWQLRVASGEPLPARQDTIQIQGHAFEARLYAEDVPAGFLPATGQLAHLAFAPGVRVETGVRPGDVISPWYDPMIAKIVTHAPTRAAALNRLAVALEATEVAGTTTNLAFLARLARHPGFGAGQVDTGLIGREIAALSAPAEVPPQARALAVIAAAGLHEMPTAGFTLWAPLRRAVAFEDPAFVQVTGPNRITVEVGGGSYDCALHPDGWWVGGVKTKARFHVGPDAVTVFMRGAHVFARPDPLDRQAHGPASDLTLAPMPGLVKAVFVAPGQRVEPGDRLAVLEAMKMEHTLCAARAGEVAQVLVSPGAQVEAGAPLIQLAEEEAAA
ncbi:3-methylcrotonoyl-CoA carboxylase alpha subunit [Rhodobacter aestuarii]|uniref:3-methylcrotonoyl-CoA carboxylase, alpha subunit n=1 Tax=Rhodobacter aestuarii TaxID=453582 RepID=A0A1N7P6B9_9RHOB|nr:acetyl/propionyl/methylcrotonyl-CoA carboxylase subunit alpha [Rhodobacter aestuarii]PTV97621.1 3-methylcrotonoyl-CoA carboxylase alpha subunit [Rhodobacter aestuarii]SIT06152.1 3-methylcrotonoyl-CoA carboxylase, alpha subunit [Rhodobacter aestuarii]